MAVATDLRKVIQDYLDSFLEYISGSEVATRLVPIVDAGQGHFLLYEIGHQDGEWIYNPWLHIRVDTANQVWIYCNQTDIPVADELLELGIPKESIVIGWLEPDSPSIDR